MLYFIIYEDEKEHRLFYKRIIEKILTGKRESYKIIEMDRFNREAITKINALDGRKIYILDIEVPGKSGLDLARMIRKELVDWESQLIVVTNHQQFREASFTSRLLMLDFVSKKFNCEKHLRDTLVDAIRIVSKNKCLCFNNGGDYTRIPYNVILYIAKLQEESSSIIVGRNLKEIVELPINKIWIKLSSDSRFFKISRNCIINLFNVTDVDFKNRIVKFGDIEVDLFARDRKKELKQRIEEISK